MDTGRLEEQAGKLEASAIESFRQRMCILNGFPTKLKTKTSFPFGLWFANANTLYVADEGDGTAPTVPQLSTGSHRP